MTCRGAVAQAIKDLIDHGEVIDEADANDDMVGPQTSEGTTQSIFHESKPVNAMFATINAGPQGVEAFLVQDLLVHMSSFSFSCSVVFSSCC